MPFDAKVYSKLRQELAEVTAEVYSGKSTYVGLEPGAKTEAADFTNATLNDMLFITKVVHRGSNGDYFADDTPTSAYENEFEAIPATTPYRPARVTPWPRVGGAHTAVVVGPDGDEIYTDEWGRVQVVFKWDEEHKLDLKHSCWVRVATASAGQQFGSVFLPRIGHEVIVEFLDGNPDNPIITGSLYNSANKHPWPLPGERNSSGIRTKSTLKGGADDFNELRFDDTKGSELIYKQAQMDLTTLVKNDEKRDVKHDRTTTITNNDERTVKEGFDKHTVEKGKQTILIADNDREITVAKNQQVTIGLSHARTVGEDETTDIGRNDTKTVGNNLELTVSNNAAVTVGADQSTTIGAKRSDTVGSDATETIGGKYNISVSGSQMTITSAMKIELKVGGSSIVIDMKGVTITGPMVTVKGNAMAKVEAPIVQIDAKGVAMIKGAVTMIN